MTTETDIGSTDNDTQITGVVVGFDGSRSSLLALDWAADAAVAYGVPLTLLRARPDAEGEVIEVDVESDAVAELLGDEQAEQLEDAADRVAESHPGLAVRAVVHPDAPVEALLDASETADLIALGSRGMEGFRGLLLGSTVMNVTPLAHCPVVVLYEPDQDAEIARANARHPEDVVVGYDGSVSADRALDFGLRHAKATGRAVAVVVVTKGRASDEPAVQVTPDDDEVSESLRELLVSAAEVAETHTDVRVTYWNAVGRPAGALIAEASGSPLAVVGARGRGGLAGLLMGSVGLQLLIHAECPVALVHAVAQD